ncbi:MAG: GNAT family N-acetyltransferase [Theionarchaea archaeon]|nr:GNAT family N-acetyltransferase [Theionarchaea archaeon]
MYTIKSYQEEFLNEQARIGGEVTKNWKSFGQTPADQLKQAYAQPGFDAETRLYCFKEGELVGFLTSKVLEKGKASLEFPMVLPDHKEAEQLLFDEILKVLRKKGVKTVETRVSEGWGNTVEMAQKWGYTFSEETAIIYVTDIGTQDIEKMPGLEEITNYDHDKDFEQMIDIFVKNFQMTPENARINFENIENAGDKVAAHLVIRKGGKIIGRALALRHDDPTRAYMGAVYVTEENQRKLLLTRILTICKEKGITKLDAIINRDLFPLKDQLIPLYESLGFNRLGTISFYTRGI